MNNKSDNPLVEGVIIVDEDGLESPAQMMSLDLPAHGLDSDQFGAFIDKAYQGLRLHELGGKPGTDALSIIGAASLAYMHSHGHSPLPPGMINDAADAAKRLLKRRGEDYQDDVVTLLVLSTHLSLRLLSSEVNKAAISRDRRRATKARWMRDGKTAERARCKAEWEQWKRNPTRFGSQADFCRAMHAVCPSIKTPKTFEKWCKEWESSRRAEARATSKAGTN